MKYSSEDNYELSVDGARTGQKNWRVPQKWLDARRKEFEPTCAASMDTPDKGCTLSKWTSWHKALIEFCKVDHSPALKADVNVVVRECKECESIDPTPICWLQGELSVPEAWKQLRMGFTHYNERYYLTLVDCGPCHWFGSPYINWILSMSSII